MRYMVFAGGALSELGKACSKTMFVTFWEERRIDMTSASLCLRDGKKKAQERKSKCRRKAI